MKMFLILIVLSMNAFSQTSSSSPVNVSEAQTSPFSLQKLRERTKISYFSETLGPSIKKWHDNEIDDDGSIKRDPMTMYHSFNMRFRTVGDLSLFMSPRFATVFGDRNDLSESYDPHVIKMDDWQFGLFYTFKKTPTFQYNQRLTHREPFSVKSRNEDIISQIEWQHDVTWLPTSALRIIFWNTYRYYAYESQVESQRHRISFVTLFNYNITDKWLVQFMHDWEMQRRTTTDKSSSDYRRWNYLDRYNNYMSFGVGYAPNTNITIIPFIRLLDERNIRNETTIVGLTLLGRVI